MLVSLYAHNSYITRRHNLKANSLVLWLLQSFYPLIHNVPWTLGVVVFHKCSHCDWPQQLCTLTDGEGIYTQRQAFHVLHIFNACFKMMLSPFPLHMQECMWYIDQVLGWTTTVSLTSGGPQSHSSGASKTWLPHCALWGRATTSGSGSFLRQSRAGCEASCLNASMLQLLKTLMPCERLKINYYPSDKRNATVIQVT